MGKSFDRLCECFREKTIGVYVQEEPSVHYVDVDRMEGEKSMYLENCIYIGTASAFKEKYDQISHGCFVLLHEDALDLKEYASENIQILELSQDQDVNKIIDATRAFVRKEVRYSQFKLALLEAYLTGEGIEKIINTASKRIGNPLIVIDLGFKVLASSPISRITDVLWMDNVKKGYCAYEFIAELTKLETLKKGRKTNQPFEVTCPASPTKKVVYRIEVDGKTIANIILLECEKTIEPEDSDYLMLISGIISKELGKKQFYKNTRNVKSEELLYDLLENKVDNKKIMKERLQSCSLGTSTHISVLVLDITNFELTQPVDSKYLNSNLLSLFPMSNSIYYEGDIVIISEGEKMEGKFASTGRVHKFLQENNLKMGVSNEFSAIEECHQYYKQARNALEIGTILDKEKCIYQYEEILPYFFIYKSESQLLKEDFYNDSLYRLKQYDEKNCTELLTTLHVFLKNNHSMTQAAEELFIHRNTLRYRLEKIVELIGLDLGADDNSFKLYYAYKSMEFYKKLKSIK